MCPMRPIPQLFPTLYDLAQVVEHLTEDMEAETVPWTFNGDVDVPWVPTAAEHAMNTSVVEWAAEQTATRGTTRVWVGLLDGDEDQEAEQETAAQRNARHATAARMRDVIRTSAARMGNLMHSSLQVIYVLDSDTLADMPMMTDGNTLVGEVHARTSSHFGLNSDSFIITYGGDFLTDSMDITTITQEETAIGASLSFVIIHRPKFVHIEFRTVEHGNIRLSVQFTDIVDTLYTRISFLTGWVRGSFTLRHENHVLSNRCSDLRELGITGDTHMVMVGSLAGGVQRFNIGSPSSSPSTSHCAAAAARMDESDISDLETSSSVSMPDMTRLVIGSSSPPPLVRVGSCPPHQLSSSPAASGSAGPGSSAAAPPWVGASSAPSAAAAEGVLQVQGLKRTYMDMGDVAPGRTYQRSTARNSSLNFHTEFSH